MDDGPWVQWKRCRRMNVVIFFFFSSGVAATSIVAIQNGKWRNCSPFESPALRSASKSGMMIHAITHHRFYRYVFRTDEVP
jgi:hypothetical protein